MPPCFGTSIHRVATTAFGLTKRSGSYRRRLREPASQLERFSDLRLPHSDSFLAIQRTSLILQRVLPAAKSSAWVKLLRASGDILSGAVVRRHRIAVLGLDPLCRAKELVSALLDDPLVSDHQIVHALRNRRTQFSNDHPLVISHEESEHSNDQLCLHLPWLKKLEVDIVEIPLGHPDAISLLYGADVQVLVTSPHASPLSLEFQSLLLSPGSFLVLDYPLYDEHVANYTVSQITRYFPTVSKTLESKMLQVYPYKALSALDAFRKEPNSLHAVQTFQDDFLGSGLTALSQSITKALLSDRKFQRAQYARSTLTGALAVCRIAEQLSSRDIATVQKFIDDLRSQIHDARTASMQDVLGGNHTPEVRDSVERSTRAMQVVIDSIPWWKLPFKIDDLSGLLFHAAEGVWCRDLYAKLEFQTGRLTSLRSQLISYTLKNLRLLPTSFHSAILVNQLHQLSSSPPPLAPNALTRPLSNRLQQLQEPIHSLHRRVQHAMVTMCMTTLGSVSGAYAGWFTAWITPATAVGLSALGFVAGLRWFIGRWEKGKTRWWADWRRVGSGLERDIKILLDLVIEEKVISVPNKAAEVLENMVDLRSREIAKMNQELENIEGASGPLPLEQGNPFK